MADDDAKDTEPSRSIPCTADGIKITIGNNKAAIAGALHEIGRWSIRTGMHVDLIQNRAVGVARSSLSPMEGLPWNHRYPSHSFNSP